MAEERQHKPLKPWMSAGRIEAGADEAGRGPLVGAVYAAAVILPPDFRHPLLNDSKQMKRKDRDALREIIQREAVAWSVEAVSEAEIDRLNILWASVAGMQRAVRKLSVCPDFLLIDGNRFRPFDAYVPSLADGSVPPGKKGYACIVKGDATYASIAAASVLAKTWRDEYMQRLAKEYPEYGWEKNMGYPTPDHIEAIKKYGLTPLHRKSFHLKQLEPALF